MGTNLHLIIIVNFIFAGLVLFIISFISLHRIALFPFRLWYGRRRNYYEFQIDQISTYQEEYDIDSLKVKNIVAKLALEDVLIQCIENSEKKDNRVFTEVYERKGLVEWRIKQLKSLYVWRRRIAADLLGKSLSRKAIVPLIVSLRDKDVDVRLIAARALGKIEAGSAIDYIISLIRDFPEKKCPTVADILIDFGEDSIPSITKALDSPDNKTRFWCVRALSEIEITDKTNLQDLEGKLVKLLSNESNRIRAYGAISLSKIGSPDKLRQIRKLLGDGSSLVRAKAASALGILRNPEAIDDLIKSLGDKIWEVNYSASRALVEFGRQIVNKLEQGLKHPQNIVRKRCKELLGELERNGMA